MYPVFIETAKGRADERQLLSHQMMILTQIDKKSWTVRKIIMMNS